MTGLSGVALAEALSATLSSVGLALLVAALLIRCLYVRWFKTDAVYVIEGNRTSLRWYTRFDVHEEPWCDPSVPSRAPGAELAVYYHTRHPDRWSLIAPYRHAWILSGVGVVLTGASFLLPLAIG